MLLNNGSGEEASLIFISFTELDWLYVGTVISDKGPWRVLGRLCRCRWGRCIALKFQDAITQRAVSYTRRTESSSATLLLKLQNSTIISFSSGVCLGYDQKVGLRHRVFLVPGLVSWGFSCFHDMRWKTAWKSPGLPSLPTCCSVVLLLIHCIYVKVVHKC